MAETVIAWALGKPLPEPVGRELAAAAQRRSRQQNAPDRKPDRTQPPGAA